MKLFWRKNIAFTKKWESQIHAQNSSSSFATGFGSSYLEGLRKVLVTVWWEKRRNIPADKFIFQLGRSLQACNVDKNELDYCYFSIILIGNFSYLLSDFQKELLAEHRMAASVCYFWHNYRKYCNFASWQHMVFI